MTPQGAGRTWEAELEMRKRPLEDLCVVETCAIKYTNLFIRKAALALWLQVAHEEKNTVNLSEWDIRCFDCGCFAVSLSTVNRVLWASAESFMQNFMHRRAPEHQWTLKGNWLMPFWPHQESSRTRDMRRKAVLPLWDASCSDILHQFPQLQGTKTGREMTMHVTLVFEETNTVEKIKHNVCHITLCTWLAFFCQFCSFSGTFTSYSKWSLSSPLAKSHWVTEWQMEPGCQAQRAEIIVTHWKGNGINDLDLVAKANHWRLREENPAGIQDKKQRLPFSAPQRRDITQDRISGVELFN